MQGMVSVDIQQLEVLNLCSRACIRAGRAANLRDSILVLGQILDAFRTPVPFVDWFRSNEQAVCNAALHIEGVLDLVQSAILA